MAHGPISIVVPVYNSADIVPEFVEALRTETIARYPGSELILVNDGSRDASWERVQEAARTHPWIRGMDLMRNFGQHNALLCGIRAASHPVIVTMDDDLQHPPAEIGKLLAALTEEVDVVYGTPREEQHGLFRDVASVVTKSAMRRAMGTQTVRDVCAFRAFRAELREAFREYASPYVSVDVLLSWATTRFTSVPVEHAPRRRGASNYTFRSLLRHAVNMLTGFSLAPLRFATTLGFFLTLFGIGVLVFVVVRYVVEGTTVPGFPFLASVVSIFSGAQLFALGVIGEYIGRMHFRIMGRPTYAIRRATPAPRATQP